MEGKGGCMLECNFFFKPVFRGIWGGVLWTHETSGQKRHTSGPEDPEGRVYREAEEGFLS